MIAFKMSGFLPIVRSVTLVQFVKFVLEQASLSIYLTWLEQQQLS